MRVLRQDSDSRTIEFLGIKFWNDSLPKLLKLIWESPGLMVVPAAPALSDMPDDAYYRKSLRTSDYAIIDSIVVAIFLVFTRFQIVHRISGLKFLQYFLLRPDISQVSTKNLLWIVPNEAEKNRIVSFLEKLKGKPKSSSFYLAPFYDLEESYRDQSLFAAIENRSPDCVVVCIGGGKQEKLGYEIRDRFANRFSVLCIGAAISFMTGGQTKIPTWADRVGLGWFYRILEKPSVYGKRYWKALCKFPAVVLRGGD